MDYNYVDGYLKKWYNNSSCSSSPVVQNKYPCPAIANATLTTYINCDCEVEVKLLTLPGLGHDYDVFFNHSDNKQVKDIIKFCKQYNTSCGKISPEEAIENIVAEPAATKRIDDGVLLIERGGKTYTIEGREVK